MSKEVKVMHRVRSTIVGFVATWALAAATAQAMTASPHLVREAAQDRTGRVWGLVEFQATGRRLCFWTGAGWEPAVLPLPFDASQSYLQKLHAADDGSVLGFWSTADAAVYLTRHEGDKVAGLGPIGREEGSYPEHFAVDATGDVWTSAQRGVYRFSRTVGLQKVKQFVSEEYHPVQVSESERRYLSPELFVDRRGTVWAWGKSDPGQPASSALRGLCRFDGNRVEYCPTIAGLPDKPFVALRRINEDKYWIVIQGEGLYELDLETVQGPLVLKQDHQAFRNIVHIEPVQDTVYVVAGGLRVDPSHLGVQATIWRFSGECWEKAADELPLGHNYSIVETAEGAWVTHGAGFLFIPGTGETPRAIDWRCGFPVRQPSAVFVLPGGSLLVTRYLLQGTGFFTVAAMPEELLSPRTIAPNLEIIHVLKPIMQDREGCLWTVLPEMPNALSKWVGTPPWQSHPMPEGWQGRRASELILDSKARVWLCQHLEQHPLEQPAGPVAIFDPSSESWTCHNSLLGALVAQLEDPQRFEFVTRSSVRPVFSQEGRIAFAHGYEWKFYYYGMMSAEAKAKLYTDEEYPPEMRTGMALTDKMDWHRFLYADFGGGTLTDYYFDPSGRLVVNTKPRGDRTTEPETWELDEQEGWRKLPYRPAPEGIVPEEPAWKNAFVNAQPPSRGPVVRDALGLLWNWYGDGGQLYKRTIGLSAPQFGPDEVHPFIAGEPISESFVDPHGNLFFRISNDEYAMVKPRLPLPDTTVELTYDGIDDVTVTMASPASEEPWFMWRLNDDDWNKPQKDPQVRLVDLTAGEHRFEAVALDKWLQPDYTPAVALIRVEVDLNEQIAGWITALSSADYDEREAAVKALIGAGEPALEALRKARTDANADLRWWIDAAIQAIEKSP